MASMVGLSECVCVCVCLLKCGTYGSAERGWGGGVKCGICSSDDGGGGGGVKCGIYGRAE